MGYIEGGRGLVGKQQPGVAAERDGDQHALSTRWRMPPLNWCG